MRIISNTRLTVFTLLCGAAFTGSAAIAQTNSSDSDTQNQTTSSSSQSDSFLDGLGSIPMSSSSSFNDPSVGDTVPSSVKLHPMPSKAADSMPAAKDHHVAKTDDNTAVIAHPETRKIMGVVSTGDTTASTGGNSGDSDSTSGASDNGDSDASNSDSMSGN